MSLIRKRAQIESSGSLLPGQGGFIREIKIPFFLF